MRAITVILLVAALAATSSLASAAATPGTRAPGALTVGLSMPSQGFQVGSVAGARVLLARGYEVDLARLVARELRLGRVVFVQTPLFSSLVAAGAKPWDIALAQVSITPARRARIDFSTPYLKADQAVLMRRGLPAVRSIAELRALQLCSERTSTGAQLIVDRIRPTRRARLVRDPSTLTAELFRGACDAVVYDAPILGAQRARAPQRVGVLAGRIVTGERYAVVLPKGSGLRPRIDRALAALRQSGALAALERRWLAADLARLPVLR